MPGRHPLRAAVAIALAALVAAGSVAAAGRREKNRADRGTASRVEVSPGLLRAPYLQALSRDSVLVVWDAPEAGEPAVDFGATADFGRTVAAISDGERHVAALRGLEPGTTYFYRIRAGDRVLAEGPRCTFRTDAGRKDRSFSFFVTGDIGSEEGDAALTAASVLRAPLRPEFALLAGDIVYKRGLSRDYDARLMHPWRDVLSQICVWPALGNHDWKSDPEENFRREWYLPNNEHYYSFDWGNAHFIALDTRDGEIYDAEAQVRWLEQDLEAHKNADWLFVWYHHPGITCTYKGNQQSVIDNFLPLFDRYRVDLVFNGHAHTYERLYPIRSGKPVDVGQDPHYTDPDGTIYVVSGAGADPKEGKPTHKCGPTAFFKDETLLWTQIVVDGADCAVRTWTSSGDALVDEVTITKTRLARLDR